MIVQIKSILKITVQKTLLGALALTSLGAFALVGGSEKTILMSQVSPGRLGQIGIPESPKTYSGIRVEAKTKMNRETNKEEITGATVESYSLTVQNGHPVGTLKLKTLKKLNKEEANDIAHLTYMRDLASSENFTDLNPDGPEAADMNHIGYYAKRLTATEFLKVGYRSSNAHTYVLNEFNTDHASATAKKLVNYMKEFEALEE